MISNFAPQARSGWHLNSNGTSSFDVGNSRIGSDGSLSTKIGSTWINSDGSTAVEIGNSKIGSDGSISTRIGSSWINSDGTVTTDFGSH